MSRASFYKKPMVKATPALFVLLILLGACSAPGIFHETVIAVANTPTPEASPLVPPAGHFSFSGGMVWRGDDLPLRAESDLGTVSFEVAARDLDKASIQDGKLVGLRSGPVEVMAHSDKYTLHALFAVIDQGTDLIHATQTRAIGRDVAVLFFESAELAGFPVNLELGDSFLGNHHAFVVESRSSRPLFGSSIEIDGDAARVSLVETTRYSNNAGDLRSSQVFLIPKNVEVLSIVKYSVDQEAWTYRGGDLASSLLTVTRANNYL